MEFRGYVYKFKLNASHSVLINNKRGNVHSHTFMIAIKIRIADDEFFLYNKIEKLVNDYLRRYEAQELNKISPFDKLEPTLENIGNFLFKEITKVFNEKKVELTRLEISENPSRVYVVNNCKDVEEKR